MKTNRTKYYQLQQFSGQDRKSSFNDVFPRIRTEYGELRREASNFIKKETPPEVLFCEF